MLLPSDLLESMRQAELCDWALDPGLFTSLCDSLNRFFTQKGMIGSSSGNNSPLALGVHPSLPWLASPSHRPFHTHPWLFPSTEPSCPGGPCTTRDRVSRGLSSPNLLALVSHRESHAFKSTRYYWYGCRWACWLWTLRI